MDFLIAISNGLDTFYQDHVLLSILILWMTNQQQLLHFPNHQDVVDQFDILLHDQKPKYGFWKTNLYFINWQEFRNFMVPSSKQFEYDTLIWKNIPFRKLWRLQVQSNLFRFQDYRSEMYRKFTYRQWNNFLNGKILFTLIPSFELILFNAAICPRARSTTWIQSLIPVPSGVSQSLPKTTKYGRLPMATKPI